MLTLDKIRFSISEKHILNNLSLNIEKGEFVMLIGNNGAGKSTMLDVISGIIKPTSGIIAIDNQDINKMSKKDKVSLIAKVVQDPKIATIGNMTIEENLNFAYMRDNLRLFKFYSSRKRRLLFKDKLSLLNMNLENRLQEYARNLSGGERQALSLIMSIVANSKVLLLDEITSALDPEMADTVMRIAAKIVKEEKRTSIMVTHNMQAAIEYGTRIIALSKGSVAFEYDKKQKTKLTPSKLAAKLY